MKFDFHLVLRNLKKNKVHALINALGLSIGISACLVIYLIASFELSFDKFQPDRDRIFRVYTQVESNKLVRDYRGTFTGAVNLLRDNVSGVEASTHFHNFWAKTVITDGQHQPKLFDANNNFVFAGPDYFKVFTIYKWLEGNPERSLTEPYKVVLTESRAKLYFGDLPLNQIVGQEIVYNDSLNFSVSGIVADINENTDFNFTDFISYTTASKLGKNAPFSFDDLYSLNNSSQLFIKLEKQVDPEMITMQFQKNSVKQTSDVATFHLQLQPLSDLHFNTNLGIFDISPRVGIKKSTIEILIALALSLLIIAVINFINLETAQSSKRAKEVGVRKVLGSSRLSLIRQFLTEIFVLIVIALLIAIGLSWFMFSYLSDFLPQGVTFHLTRPDVAVFLLLCLICVTLLAGIYPSFILSSYRPYEALKNLTRHSSRTSRSSFVRKGLTIFQFCFSQTLIIVTIVVGLQIKHMIDTDLGFSTEAIITFRTPSQANEEKKSVMRSNLAQIEGVEMISLQSQPPSGGDGNNSLLFVFEKENEILEDWINVKYGDASYIDLYDIKLLAGKNFIQSDSAKGYLINEAYMRKLGFSNPRDVIGKSVNETTIIGVVKDFHTESLHATIQPTAIIYDSRRLNSFGVKLAMPEDNHEKISQTIAKIETAWKQVYPDTKLELSFIDSRIRSYYEVEQRISKLAGVSTGIAIFISCLGLFGLSSFTAMERTKEIGVRKVMGASVGSILVLLSLDFLKLVLIAFIVAAPIAFYFANEWLTEFAFKIDLSIWIFVISGVLSITLAFLTISFKVIKTAKIDPVKSLRYE